MDENEDMDEALGREWQVERVLEPKDVLIPKGMKTIAKTLRHAGQLLAVATSPNPDNPDEPFRAFITVSRKNRSEIKAIIYELTPEQYGDLFEDESE
ncbi:hypothetical protein [Collinsella aerofaciens]|uniref:hypothetical protein n=1 Tax=Collinsella aerofaciens TaxID=74426 RepID=UPI003D797E5F